MSALSVASAGSVSPLLDLYRTSQSNEDAQPSEFQGLGASKLTADSGGFCSSFWALRHRMVHIESGLSLPMNCGLYPCLFCGPRKVSLWRDLVQLAEPERFITFTRMGGTVAEASLALSVIIKRLRRGSRCTGRGGSRRHGRASFQFEYFATFEQHKNGTFHAHVLQKGDYIPHSALSEALRSATHGRSFVTWVNACDAGTAGYVTKYMTKQLSSDEVGIGAGGVHLKPKRLRYSRRFFPSPTELLRDYLRAQGWDARRDRGEEVDDLDGEWALQEVAEVPRDLRGRVDQEAAQRLYDELLIERAREVGTEVHHARGGLMVLAYMLGKEADG